MRIIPRAEWAARAPKSTTRLVIPVPRVHIHHSAAKAFGIDVSKEDDVMRSMQNYHMDSRGWSDIGYNFVVFPSGNIYEGRGWNVGAHSATDEVPRENQFSLGICFAGNFQTEPVQQVAIDAARWLIDHAKDNGKLNLKATIDGHRDVPGAATACPGTNLYAKLAAIRVAYESTSFVVTWKVVRRDGSRVAHSASRDWFERLTPYLKKEAMAHRYAALVKVVTEQ